MKEITKGILFLLIASICFLIAGHLILRAMFPIPTPSNAPGITVCETEDCFPYPLPCKTYNINDYTCVREGHTGTGFLGFKDFDTVYYVCEDLGRVALACEEHYNTEEFKELLNDRGVEDIYQVQDEWRNQI